MVPDFSLLRQKVQACRLCRLHKTATQPVFGEGNERSEIMFVGEAPGRQEDLQGKPFVGAAGKFLNEMLAEIGLNREDVFITNIVKHRPPENRDPLPDEIKACSPYLDAQIKIIKPLLIVTLGRHAMNYFLPDLIISQVHGKPKRVKSGQVFLPLYHPASALYNGALRQTHINDMKIIPALLKKIKKELIL